MIFFVRHGERADQCGKQEYISQIEKSFDPHLTKVGIQQAQMTGQYLSKLIQEYATSIQVDFNSIKVIVMCSPFIRCIMTAFHIMNQLPNVSELYLQDEITELMMDFDREIQHELHSRVNKPIHENYIPPGKIQIIPHNFINSPNFIKAKFPENWKNVRQRVRIFTQELCEQYKKVDMKSTIYLCVTHQGILELVAESLKSEHPYIDYCAVTQIVFQNNNYQIGINGVSVWK